MRILVNAIPDLFLPALGEPSPAFFALIIVGGLGVFVTLFGLGKIRELQARRFLTRLILLGLLARLAVLILVEISVGPFAFAPDALTYEIVGRKIVEAWEGLRPMPPEMADSSQFAYYLINALFFSVFGLQPAAPRALNIICGVWVAIPVYFLARGLARGDDGIGRIAAVLTVFFPSLILWSVLNIREAPTILALVSIVFFLHRVGERIQGKHVLGLALAMVALALSREYLFVLVVCSAAIGLLASGFRSLGGGIALGALLTVLVLVVSARTQLGVTVPEVPSLEVIDYLRRDLAAGAGSAYGAGARTTTISGLLRYLPVGLAYFLLAPFPWSIGSMLQAVTLPEQLAWYVLLFFAIWGIVLALKESPRRFSVLLFVVGTIVLSYSLVEGNVGTAFRHRAQVYPFLFIFAALGLGRFRDLRIAARNRRLAVRRSALNTLPRREKNGRRDPGLTECGEGP
jgi:hypothetical protein